MEWLDAVTNLGGIGFAAYLLMKHIPDLRKDHKEERAEAREDIKKAYEKFDETAKEFNDTVKEFVKNDQAVSLRIAELSKQMELMKTLIDRKLEKE